MNTSPLLGLHHVTAIGGPPARNVDFYTRLLGLRLVKQTVNFDDPGTWHLYYGDESGRPGTVVTFFPCPLAMRGSRGLGQVTTTALRVPTGALGEWRDRLRAAGVPVEEPAPRFGEERLRVLDPDGLELELVPSAATGVHGVTLASVRPEATRVLLVELLGFAPAAVDGDRERFLLGAGDAAARVDVLAGSVLGHGRIAAGSVHHVAWRVADDAAQEAWRERLLERGLHVSPVMDRQYFRSIYFREPGGILFEIATDPPGFLRDEPLATLGSELKLPPWLEPHRERIAAALPPLGLGGSVEGAA